MFLRFGEPVSTVSASSNSSPPSSVVPRLEFQQMLFDSVHLVQKQYNAAAMLHAITTEATEMPMMSFDASSELLESMPRLLRAGAVVIGIASRMLG